MLPSIGIQLSGTSESIPISKAEIKIGTYQNIILVSERALLHAVSRLFF